MLNDNRWFKWLRPAKISIKTANNVTELANEQGAAVLHAYDRNGRHAPLMLHNAVHAPQMHSLVPVSRLLDVGVKVELPSTQSCLKYFLTDSMCRSGVTMGCSCSTIWFRYPKLTIPARMDMSMPWARS